MATEKPSNEIELHALVESAGRSLAEAQGSLGVSADVSPQFILANAELEIRTAVGCDAKGRMTLQPISTQDIHKGGIAPGMLSTVRINFIGAAGEPIPSVPSVDKPERDPADIIDDIRKRPDVAALDSILGGLTMNATFIAEKKRWLVTAKDSQDHVVRELIIPDEMKEDGRA